MAKFLLYFLMTLIRSTRYISTEHSDIRRSEYMPAVYLPTAAAHAPLLGVRPLRAGHGPPLSVAQQLCRLLQRTVLLPLHGLHGRRRGIRHYRRH